MNSPPTRPQWSHIVDTGNALPNPPEFLTRDPGADRDVEDILGQPAMADGHPTGQAGRRRWLRGHVYLAGPPYLRAFAYWLWRYVVLLGFLDFAGATLLRSSFFRPAGPARDWLDRDHIRRVAERFSGQDATGPPVLSHDGPPDHLAWRVPMPSGAVFVAGASAWWARLRPDDVTG